MSITQTAATLEAYDIKIRELKAVEDALSRELFRIDAAVAFSKTVTIISGLWAVIGSFASFLTFVNLNRQNEPINLAVFMSILTFPGIIWFIIRLNKSGKKNVDRKSIVRKLQIAENDLRILKGKKSAIVSGVVAVTNMEMSAATIADKAVESPVDSSMSEKTCPMCAETVKAAAKICKHCKHAF
jgi:hypothetical protein